LRASTHSWSLCGSFGLSMSVVITDATVAGQHEQWPPIVPGGRSARAAPDAMLRSDRVFARDAARKSFQKLLQGQQFSARRPVGPRSLRTCRSAQALGAIGTGPSAGDRSTSSSARAAGDADRVGKGLPTA
jgi:hypothetical protein